ncbi:hypothetical protein R1sor_027243 [Riccia sorocarpa]|uniref:Uncharacterized protein n=1 Tax=Riccia sorocarpa TaxID=122646 RepID=A0ABD3GDN9_9MARC
MTSGLIMCNFLECKGISEEVVEGGVDIWRTSDIVAFAETWDCREETNLSIPDFTRMTVLWNEKRSGRGRGFGGLAVWCRNSLSCLVKLLYSDPQKQFVCLGVGISQQSSFVFTYFAPWGFLVYSSEAEDYDPFLQLSHIVLAASINVDMDPKAVTKTLLLVAGRVFGRTRPFRNQWFDQTCQEARRKAIEASEEERQEVHRSYRNLIKAKKRQFLRVQQEEMTVEFFQEPWRFWQRLKPARVAPKLEEAKLQSYLAQLYHFLEVEGVPPAARPFCQFSEEDVSNELRGLGTRKDADIFGLTMELILWGGDQLLGLVTKFMTWRRVMGSGGVEI